MLLGLSILAVSCSPAAEPGPSLHIAISPAAQPVSAAVAACMPNTEDLSATVEIRYADFVDLDEVDFFIQLGQPAELPEFAAQLAWEEIVVIVHAENELELSRSHFMDLFSGRVEDWSELGGEARGQALLGSVQLTSPQHEVKSAASNAPSARSQQGAEPGAKRGRPRNGVKRLARQPPRTLRVGDVEWWER